MTACGYDPASKLRRPCTHWLQPESVAPESTLAATSSLPSRSASQPSHKLPVFNICPQNSADTRLDLQVGERSVLGQRQGRGRFRSGRRAIAVITRNPIGYRFGRRILGALAHPRRPGSDGLVEIGHRVGELLLVSRER